MEKNIPKLKLGTTTQSAQVYGTVNAAALLATLQAEQNMAATGMKPEALLRTFSGIFQQLSKSEMGSQSFRMAVTTRLSAIAQQRIDELANKLSAGPGELEIWMGEGWAILAVELHSAGIAIDFARVEALLMQYRTMSLAGKAADGYANALIDEFLRPLLQHLQ